MLTAEDLKITIVDTGDDDAVADITGGATVSFDLLDGVDASISVEVTDPSVASDVGSMRLTLGGVVQVENVSPYALFGDKNGDFLGGQEFDPGDYTLKVEVFAGANAGGGLLSTATTNFAVEGDAQPPDAPSSVASPNAFEGVRLWISNDISEIDDAASLASLMLGAKSIAASDQNVTGSAGKMTLEGAFVDTVRPLARNWVDDVEEVAANAAARYGIDVYSPRGDIDIGGGRFFLKKAMLQSLDTAFESNEQMIVVAGGPTKVAMHMVTDWIDGASGADQVAKAAWVLRGGFSQVSHGDTVRNNGELDYTRDPSRDYFNIGKPGDGDFIQTKYEQLYNKLLRIAKKGGIDTEDFVEDSLLVSIEDQNANPAVRGPIGNIAPTIGDDLARGYATEYTKNNGTQIDISDVGMLGILLAGNDPLSAADMSTFLDSDWLV
ncbi:MAG: hypothetical protein AAGB11_01365 [Pseudomonadota bacterium]